MIQKFEEFSQGLGKQKMVALHQKTKQLVNLFDSINIEKEIPEWVGDKLAIVERDLEEIIQFLIPPN